MPQFDISTFPSQLFWLFATLSFLVIVIHFYIHPKMSSVQEMRDHAVSDAVKAAEDVKEQISSFDVKYNNLIKEAKNKALETIAAAKTEIALYNEKLGNEFKDLSEKYKIEAQKTFEEKFLAIKNNSEKLVKEIEEVILAKILY